VRRWLCPAVSDFPTFWGYAPSLEFRARGEDRIKGVARFNEFGLTAGQSHLLTSDGEAGTFEAKKGLRHLNVSTRSISRPLPWVVASMTTEKCEMIYGKCFGLNL